jgi:hypothetical protein
VHAVSSRKNPREIHGTRSCDQAKKRIAYAAWKKQTKKTSKKRHILLGRRLRAGWGSAVRVEVFAFFVLLALALRREGMRRLAPAFVAWTGSVLSLLLVGPFEAALRSLTSSASSNPSISRYIGFIALFCLGLMIYFLAQDRQNMRRNSMRNNER